MVFLNVVIISVVCRAVSAASAINLSMITLGKMLTGVQGEVRAKAHENEHWDFHLFTFLSRPAQQQDQGVTYFLITVIQELMSALKSLQSFHTDLPTPENILSMVSTEVSQSHKSVQIKYPCKIDCK